MQILYEIGFALLLVNVANYTATKISTERLVTEYYNTRYISHTDTSASHFNRTFKVMNLTFTLIKTFENEDAYIGGQAYVFLVNRYVLTGIRGQINLAKSYKNNVMGIRKFLQENCEPPMNQWPFPIGIYHVYNIDSIDVPNVPEGRYKIVLTTHYRQELIYKSVWYGKIEN